MTRETTAKARGRAWGRFGVAAALAVTVALPVAAARNAGAAELRWKFKAGEALHYEMVQKTVTEIKANGQEIKTTLGQTIDSTWKVDAVAEDGTAELSQSLDRVRTQIESAFGKFEYDSQVEKEPEGAIAAGVVPMLKALVGTTFRYKMSPRGELSEIRVPDGLVQKLKAAGPTAGNIGMFSEDGLKNMILESSLGLPAESIEVGKSWTRQSKIPSPPIGTLVMNKTYRYEGPAQNGERIGLEVEIALEGTPENQVEITVGAQTGKGFFLFDNKAGRVAESSVSEKIQMLIKAMGQEITQVMDTSTSMKLVDDKPTAPKPADEAKPAAAPEAKPAETK